MCRGGEEEGGGGACWWKAPRHTAAAALSKQNTSTRIHSAHTAYPRFMGQAEGS